MFVLFLSESVVIVITFYIFLIMYPFFSEEGPGSRRRTVYNYFYQSRGCLPDALVNKASLSYRYIVKFNMLYSHVRAQVVLQYLLSISIHKLQNQFIQFYLCFSPFPFSTFITPSESQIFSPWRQTSHLSVPFAATTLLLKGGVSICWDSLLREWMWSNSKI